MDNPVTTTDAQIRSESRLQKIVAILAVLTVVLCAAFAMLQFRHADPYVKSVLSLSGSPTQGQVIFELNCAGCHGLGGDGRVGPSLHHVSSRKSRVGLIQQVTSGKTPPMPQFQPTPQEMADLLEYLGSL